MDVDWIFGNEVLASREERLYVDYIEDEDGERRWVGPADREAIHDSPFASPQPASQVVRLIAAMRRVGLLTEVGLELTRTIWKGIETSDEMHWSELQPLTMKVIQALVAVSDGKVDPEAEEDGRALRIIYNHWIFPLTTLDLRLVKVELDDLKQQRERWLARQMGYGDDAAW